MEYQEMFAKLLKIRTLVVLLLMLTLASAVYGFAAQNTIAESGAGEGEEVITGYDITNIVYDLNTTNPTQLDAVSFAIAEIESVTAPAVTVKVRLVSGGSWYNCSMSGGTATCTINPGIQVDTVNVFQVVATSSTNP